MGFAKNQMMEQDERGFGSLGKVICLDCVGDYALNNFILNKGFHRTCDYCKNEGSCVEAESLLETIMDGIY